MLLLVVAAALAGEAGARDTVVEAERQAASAAAGTAEAAQRAAQNDSVDIDDEMRAAQARLEEAARRIAELSSRRLPQIDAERYRVAFSGRPMLGITIDGDSGSGPAEGAHIRGVTPGGPAFEAGLRAGDIITSINKESMSADNGAAANKKVLDFMAGVEEGDQLDIEYLRDGKAATVTLAPATRFAHSFAFGVSGVPAVPGVPGIARAPRAPLAPDFNRFVFFQREGGWGDMEMVALTKDLGRYFGTDKGLLVVRAPGDASLKLQDGDVIHAIDGREPGSVSHAVRSLGSYQAGEALKIDIVRDKKRQTLTVEMPDDRSSAVAAPPLPPAVTGVAPVVEIDRSRQRAVRKGDAAPVL